MKAINSVTVGHCLSHHAAILQKDGKLEMKIASFGGLFFSPGPVRNVSLFKSGHNYTPNQAVNPVPTGQGTGPGKSGNLGRNRTQCRV